MHCFDHCTALIVKFASYAIPKDVELVNRVASFHFLKSPKRVAELH